MVETLVYYTHDNGGRPFKCVVMDNRRVNVHREIDNEMYSEEADCKFNGTVMVGVSPETTMTRLSQGFGPEFDGNSILVVESDGTCVFIGDCIYSFVPVAPISQFASPVGNSDVPYPYAVDELDNYYFLSERTMVDGDFVGNREDPYNDLYRLCNMTGFENIANVNHPTYTDGPYTMTTSRNNGIYQNLCIHRTITYAFITKADGSRLTLNAQQYQALIERCEASRGISTLAVCVLLG